MKGVLRNFAQDVAAGKFVGAEGQTLGAMTDDYVSIAAEASL